MQTCYAFHCYEVEVFPPVLHLLFVIAQGAEILTLFTVSTPFAVRIVIIDIAQIFCVVGIYPSLNLYLSGATAITYKNVIIVWFLSCSLAVIECHSTIDKQFSVVIREFGIESFCCSEY